MHVPPGFDPHGVLIARTQFDDTRYPKQAQVSATEREIIRQLRHLPGVETVGFVSTLPLADNRQIGFRVEGSSAMDFRQADNALVDENYLSAMGIPMVRGRNFSQQDTSSSALVAVVNQTLAKVFLPGQNPIGKRLLWGGRPFTIVGVAADVHASALDTDVGPMIYMSNYQVTSGVSRHAVFVIRTAGDAGSLAPEVRSEIASVDGDLPVFGVMTMDNVLASSVEQRQFATSLLAGFACLALLMAAIGLYGVLSYAVTERTHEMGVRMALGARASDVLRLVVGHGMRVALAGIVIGLVGAAAVTRVLSRMLFGVSPLDPMTFAAVAAVLITAALLASYIPARRAADVDPMVALRYE
jgi:putative ABC transport system permease protein